MFACICVCVNRRTLPVKAGKIDQQNNTNVYMDPLYTTHIVTGAGGCREFYDFYDEVFYGAWSVIRSASYGYGRMTVYNATHLHWEQLLDEGRGGTDSLWIVKQDKHQSSQQSDNNTEAADFQVATIESAELNGDNVSVETFIAPTPVVAAPSTTLLGEIKSQQIATE